MAITKVDDRGLKTPIDLLDNEKIRFGTGNDLEIYHSGSHSYIKDTGTGGFNINTSALYVTNAADSENMVAAIENGAVNLYYDGVKTFATTTNGAIVYGTEGAGAQFYLYADEGDDNADKWRFSTGNDGDVYFQNYADGAWETSTLWKHGAAVELYYDNVKTFETTTNGVIVTGTEAGNSFVYMYADEGDDNADKYRLSSLTNGNWEVQNYSSGSAWETNIRATGGGLVSLYYDDAKKLETTADGVTVNGDLNLQQPSSTTNYIQWDNSEGKLKLKDDIKITVGDGEDLKIYHDGSNSYLDNDVGGVRLNTASGEIQINKGTSEYMGRFITDGGVELYYDSVKKFYTISSGTVTSGHHYLIDNNKLILGSSDDLQIYHDGIQSIINDSGNKLQVRSDLIQLMTASGKNEYYLIGTEDGAVELYYDNVKKLETTSTGIQLSDYLYLNDGKEIRFGDDEDLQIWHDGSHGYIDNDTGWLYVGSDNYSFQNKEFNETHARFVHDGAVELYYDGSKKFETTSNGITVTGNYIGSDWIKAQADNKGFTAGASDDLQIYHNGSHSYLAQSGTGSIILDVTSGQGTYIQTSSASYSNLSLNKSHSDANSVDYFQCRDSSNNLKLHILSTGNVQNANNSYGQTSDSKLKENIVDANSQWEDIKAVKVRNFNFKASTGLETHKQIGVIAQEIESVSAGLVTETVDRDPETQVDLGTKTKSVKYSILYMKAIKALQEAMAKIEVLETEVAALKAK